MWHLRRASSCTRPARELEPLAVVVSCGETDDPVDDLILESLGCERLAGEDEREAEACAALRWHGVPPSGTWWRANHRW